MICMEDFIYIIWKFASPTSERDYNVSYTCTLSILSRSYCTKMNVLTAVYRTPGKTPGRGQNIFKCSYDTPPPPGKVCDIDVRQWNPCTFEERFGYHVQQPCIFIKLNKVSCGNYRKNKTKPS